MEYTEVDITFKELEPYADILVAKLNEIDFESYAENVNGIKAYVKTKLLNKNAVKEILSEISDLTEISFTINQIKQENWNAKWESNYPPVIHKDYVIRAPFHDPFPEIKYEVIINPKMSFGTGHHETTSLIIEEMLSLDFNNKSILDVGTGTGVLSILASKLGAREIVGVDCDALAVENAKENARLNNIANIHFIHQSSNNIGYSNYDIFLVNINRNIILNDIEHYVTVMHSSSRVLLSGFLKEDVPLILKKTEQLALELVVLKNKNKWQMLHLKKV